MVVRSEQLSSRKFTGLKSIDEETRDGSPEAS